MATAAFRERPAGVVVVEQRSEACCVDGGEGGFRREPPFGGLLPVAAASREGPAGAVVVRRRSEACCVDASQSQSGG